MYSVPFPPVLESTATAGSPAPVRTGAPVSGSRTATDRSLEMSITRDQVNPLSVERISDSLNWFAEG